MDTEVARVWEGVQQRIRRGSGYELLSPWIDRLEPVALSRGRLAVQLDDPGLRRFFTHHHLELLSQAASRDHETPLAVFLFDGQTPEHQVGKSRPLPGADAALNSEYTFDTFLKGPSNRLAVAAAAAACQAPGRRYNPVYLYGRLGMGKTHLLQAACRNLRERWPEKRVHYLSCEDYLHAAATGPGPGPAARLDARGADALLLDDAQLLAGHEQAQEHFAHLFDALHNTHRQIVLSANVHPKDLSRVREALVSRFQWGLVIEIEPPQTSLRREIVRRKARTHGAQLDDEVAGFLAEAITGNIRALEGAVLKVVGYASLLNQALTLGLARHVLRDYLPHARARKLTVRQIQEATCDVFNISLADLVGKRRSRTLVQPRHLAMFLSRTLTPASLEEVGHQFGHRDHSTVKHACEKVSVLLREDPTTHATVDALKKKLSTS